jgi:hypothetical protein
MTTSSAGTTAAPDRSSHEGAMVRDKQPIPYPAEKARGGEIILRRPWQRVVFILGLALPLLLLIGLVLLRLATR